MSDQPEVVPADEPPLETDVCCDGGPHTAAPVPVGDQHAEAAWQEWIGTLEAKRWDRGHKDFLAGWEARGPDREAAIAEAWDEGHAMCCNRTDCGGNYYGTPHRVARDTEGGNNYG